MNYFKRPQTPEGGSYCTTPKAAEVLDLLGGEIRASVAMTRDEAEQIKCLYGYVPEGDNPRPPPPKGPVREDFPDIYAYDRARTQWLHDMEAWSKWKDPKPFLQAGADVGAHNHAECDGLRLLAWISRYVDPGQDPVAVLVDLAVQAGFDVDPEDAVWAQRSLEGEDSQEEDD